MDKSVSELTTKALSLIKPASAILTFSKRPLEALRAGGPAGVMNFYKDEVLPTWHPPTLEGFGKALESDLGMGIVNALVGRAVSYIGGLGGVTVIGQIGRAIKDGGEGQALGGLADLVIHASAFNPHSGRSKGGKSSEWKGRGVAHAATPDVLRFA